MSNNKKLPRTNEPCTDEQWEQWKKEAAAGAEEKKFFDGVTKAVSEFFEIYDKQKKQNEQKH